MTLRARPLFSSLSFGTPGGGGAYAVDPVAVVLDSGPLAIVLEDDDLDAHISDDDLVGTTSDLLEGEQYVDDLLVAVPR